MPLEPDGATEDDAAIAAVLQAEEDNATPRSRKSSEAVPADGDTATTAARRGILAQPDCGECVNCLDKPKFGGPGTKKQACKLKVHQLKAIHRPDWGPKSRRTPAVVVEPQPPEQPTVSTVHTGFVASFCYLLELVHLCCCSLPPAAADHFSLPPLVLPCLQLVLPRFCCWCCLVSAASGSSDPSLLLPLADLLLVAAASGCDTVGCQRGLTGLSKVRLRAGIWQVENNI